MRIRDEYLHGSDQTGVVKKIEVTTGTGNNANQSVIKYIKADSEGGVVEVPIGDITGKAATASKLDNTSAIGSKTNPVYFTANGVPSACTYSLNATVPVGSANKILYYSAQNTLDVQSYSTLTSNLDVFTVATSSAAGKKGLVPAPSANQLGSGNFFLRADGVWTVIESKSAAQNGTATSLVTTGEKYNWNSAYNWYNSMTSGDTDGIINKWKEVEAFLENYGDSSTLAAELAKLVTLSTNQTITGVKTFSEVINGSITGNAGTANKLKNTVNINGVAFDGSTDITITATANGGNADTVGGYSPSDFLLKTEHETFESVIATSLTDLDNRKIEASDIPTSLPANGGNAATATKLQTARTIWGQSFDGTADVSGALTDVSDITASGHVSDAALRYTSNNIKGIGWHTVAHLPEYTCSADVYISNSYYYHPSQGLHIRIANGVIEVLSSNITTITKVRYVDGDVDIYYSVQDFDTFYWRIIGNGCVIANGSISTKTGGYECDVNKGISINSNLKASGNIYAIDGFMKEGSSDSYVLLGGGGHKAVSDFATAGHTHSYLPLSGGTITGVLTINTEMDSSLIFDEPTGEKYHIISFRASGEEYAYILAKSDNRLYFNGYTIYHSGNLTASVIGGLGTLSNNISGNAATASSVDWGGVTNKPTNVSAFENDKGYLTSHAYSYGSIDIYDVNGAKKTSNNTVSASVNTETLRLQEGANIAITATNSGTSGSDVIKIAVTGITSNIDRPGYGKLALWYNGASAVSTTLQSADPNELLTVKAGSGIDFSGVNGTANNDIWTISAIPYNCAITLNNNSIKSLIKDTWSADAQSVYLTSDGTSSGTSLVAGTYALWIEDRSSSSGTPNYYSGTFTCAGSATAGRLDEIALHSSMATSADTNAPTRIFVATQISGTSGKHVLRFCSQDSSATNHYLTVKVNRII